MKFITAAAVAASVTLYFTTVAVTPAYAGDSEDFAGCDGLRKPKFKDDGMRGVATRPGYGFVPSNAAGDAAATIASCTRALTGGKLLPTQTLRQAHLLRARAAAKLRLNASSEALSDLDLADEVMAGQRGELFFDRSLGASLDLLRAIALVQIGKNKAALSLAEHAAAQRPFAVQLQMAAAMVRQAASYDDATVDPRWGALVRLQPDLAPPLISLETSLGRYDSAIAIGKAAPLNAPLLSRDEDKADKFDALSRYGRALLATTGGAYDLAYALAASGDAKAARAELEAARVLYRKLTGAAVLPPAPAGAHTLKVTAEGAAADGSMFASRERMVEARIALVEGRIADAEKIVGEPLPFGAPARDLYNALIAAKGVKTAQLIAPEMQVDRGAASRKAIGQLADTVLIAYETPRSVIDYQKSRPNVLAALVGAALSMGTTLLSGIPKTQGFKETINPDGTIVVEYTGSTPSAPMVQEMTLLRAAELAHAAKKPGFAIVGRDDYTRYLTQMQYGATISSTPTGHMTVMTVRLLDTPEAVKAQGFDAVDVIDRLAPLYYEDKSKA